MAAKIPVGLLFVGLFIAAIGVTHGMDDSCLAMSECLGASYNSVLMNREIAQEVKCRAYQTVLNCLNPLLEECKNSGTANRIADRFAMTRDRVAADLQNNCDAGMLEGTGSTPTEGQTTVSNEEFFQNLLRQLENLAAKNQEN